LLPYQSQPFGSISYALFKTTGDYSWLPVFVRESEIWRKDVKRSAEGAVLIYARENPDLYALVIDHIQEYAARMARSGKHTGDRSYFIEAVSQFRIARSIFRNDKNGLYWLGRGWEEGKPDKLAPGAWSRGHGWLLKGMVETLSLLPRESKEFLELKTMFIEVVEALLPIQQPSGMWHTLLHRPPDESVAESSGTAMIATAFSRAYREGILDDNRLKESAIKAFKVLNNYVDEEGRVLSTSPGPGPLTHEEPYIKTEFKPGDTHGSFAMIFAAAEAIRLENYIENLNH
jgi:rhamnogalacturonyl hydrolase YesR